MVVIRVPLIVGLVRTSMTSCANGWHAREGLWLRVCGPFVDWVCSNRALWCPISLDKQPGDLILDGLFT